MKRFYRLLLIFCVLICSTNIDAVAGTWTEDFNQNRLNSWTKREHQRERVTWQAKNGRLVVQTKSFCTDARPGEMRLPLKTHYTLAFTDFPIETDELRVKMTGLRGVNSNMGIFLGKQPQDVLDNPLRQTYQFMNHFIGAPLDLPIKRPFVELELKEIEIAFKQGTFELFSQGEKIVDFQDDNFQTIAYIGIAVIIKRCVFDASAIANDFVISGPSIPNGGSWNVQSKDKAAVVWGALKHR